jgi:hypothetical protein
MEHYEGIVGVHKKFTQNYLAEFSGGKYIDKDWMYTEEQVAIATEKRTEKVLSRTFWPRLINPGMATCYQSYK